MSAPFPVVIHHNPACGTPRATLALIEAAGHRPTLIDYLETGFTRGYLLTLFAAAGVTPRQALREKEGAALRDAGEEEILAAMLRAPVLVQRPFVATPKGVRLCRPSELVRALL